MNVLLTLILFLFSSVIVAAPINNIVVFGDSLSDNGNLYNFMDHKIPECPPYYQGRFSNGPVWIEQLATNTLLKPSKQLLDYAFGGAGASDIDDEDVIFTLNHEMEVFLLAHNEQASPNDLYVIWIGANNYLTIPEQQDEAVNEVVGSIKKSLERLADKGAKHILVINLPDLGRTPLARDIEAETELSQLVNKHNNALAAMLDDLKKSHSDVQWLSFDAYKAVEQIMAAPEDYGFNNIYDTCYDTVIEKNPTHRRGYFLKMFTHLKQSKTDGCEGNLFFDPVHPTARAHQIIADEVKAVLLAQGISFQK